MKIIKESNSVSLKLFKAKRILYNTKKGQVLSIHTFLVGSVFGFVVFAFHERELSAKGEVFLFSVQCGLLKLINLFIWWTQMPHKIIIAQKVEYREKSYLKK